VVTDQSDPNGYTLNTNFIIPQYQIAAQYVVWETGVGLVDKTFSQIITFTRASTATYFDSTGTLQSAAIDAPRFDYNPSTLAAQGLLIEESRTNSIRNNTMVGAVAGTPGTVPTNWLTTVPAGLSLAVAATGTFNGINYVDLAVSGTASASGQIFISPEATTQIVAASGQTWATSWYFSLVAGSVSSAGLSSQRYDITGRDAGGVTQETFSFTYVPTSAALNTQRVSSSATLANAGTVRINTAFRIDVANGAVISFTLRIGLPQLELGAFATSVIPTTTTALTRAADVASVNTLSPWFNATTGTLFVEASPQASNVGGFNLAELSTDVSNRIGLFKLTSTGNASLAVLVGGATQASTNSGAWTATGKFAGAYATDDFASSLNGSAAATDTSGTVPSVTTLTLGRRADGANVLNGYLRRVVFYPRRLSDAELVSITS